MAAPFCWLANAVTTVAKDLYTNAGPIEGVDYTIVDGQRQRTAKGLMKKVVGAVGGIGAVGAAIANSPALLAGGMGMAQTAAGMVGINGLAFYGLTAMAAMNPLIMGAAGTVLLYGLYQTYNVGEGMSMYVINKGGDLYALTFDPKENPKAAEKLDAALADKSVCGFDAQAIKDKPPEELSKEELVARLEEAEERAAKNEAAAQKLLEAMELLGIQPKKMQESDFS